MSEIDEAQVERRDELRGLLLRLVLGVGGFFAAVLLLARAYHEPLRALGVSFVERFGLAGIAAGTFIADAFSCPIPPQVYMFAALTSGRSMLAPMACICVTSLLAGTLGYHMASRFVRVAFFRRLLERTGPQMARLFERWGPWAVVIASLSPLPYSGICYTAGLYRMPTRLFVMYLALRVPRLLGYCLLLWAGWSL